MQINDTLTYSNISALSEGHKLLDLLSADQYEATFKPAFQSTIGAHFRHVIEHYQCFFEQLKEQHFSYDLRRRNHQLETDVTYAQEVLLDLVTSLRNLEVSAFNQPYTVSDEPIVGKIETSLARELLFLHSHTTHHYAIIAAIARSQGIQLDTNFGVATATQSYQMMTQEMEKSTCAQ